MKVLMVDDNRLKVSPYKEVGAWWVLSPQAITYHMAEIMNRLHLENRAQVLAFAGRMGWAADTAESRLQMSFRNMREQLKSCKAATVSCTDMLHYNGIQGAGCDAVPASHAHILENHR